MEEATKKTAYKKDEFDYFFVLIKNWKIILFWCLTFLVVGGVYLFINPKSHMVKSTFSVSLKNQINSTYGSYDLKTANPIHYLLTLQQNNFRDSVLLKTGSQNLKGIKFEVEEEEITQDPKALVAILPNKFDFIVSGEEESNLIKINEEALSMLLQKIDEKIQMDMFDQFSFDLKNEIDSIKFIIQFKEKLIKKLKENLNNGVQLRSDKTEFSELIDDRLINNLEGSERGLIISILLNGDKGNQYYQETVLSIEEIQLKMILNTLERKELLLATLIENNNNGTLSALFDSPFSNNYLLLTTPEVKMISNLNGNIKRMLMLFFIGLFLSSSIVLIQSYYKRIK